MKRQFNFANNSKNIAPCFLIQSIDMNVLIASGLELFLPFKSIDMNVLIASGFKLFLPFKFCVENIFGYPLLSLVFSKCRGT